MASSSADAGNTGGPGSGSQGAEPGSESAVNAAQREASLYRKRWFGSAAPPHWLEGQSREPHLQEAEQPALESLSPHEQEPRTSKRQRVEETGGATVDTGMLNFLSPAVLELSQHVKEMKREVVRLRSTVENVSDQLDTMLVRIPDARRDPPRRW